MDAKRVPHNWLCVLMEGDPRELVAVCHLRSGQKLFMFRAPVMDASFYRPEEKADLTAAVVGVDTGRMSYPGHILMQGLMMKEVERWEASKQLRVFEELPETDYDPEADGPDFDLGDLLGT